MISHSQGEKKPYSLSLLLISYPQSHTQAGGARCVRLAPAPPAAPAMGVAMRGEDRACVWWGGEGTTAHRVSDAVPPPALTAAYY